MGCPLRTTGCHNQCGHKRQVLAYRDHRAAEDAAEDTATHGFAGDIRERRASGLRPTTFQQFISSQVWKESA